jgi:hypothetical protein
MVQCVYCGLFFRSIPASHLLAHKEDLLKDGLGEKPDSIIADMSRSSRRIICAVRNRLHIAPPSFLYLTKEGLSCRSQFEAKYDAYLHYSNIPHEHEVRVPGLPYIADFRIDGVYIEIAGMYGYKKYETKMRKKISDYIDKGIDYKILTDKDVDSLIVDLPVTIEIRKRYCSVCELLTKDLVNGMCRPCSRKLWGKNNGYMSHCHRCNGKYIKNAGSPGQKYCSRSCYWKSLRSVNWPTLQEIDDMRRSRSIIKIAKDLGVEANTLYMHIYRERNKNLSR